MKSKQRKSTPQYYLNGRYVSEANAMISALDRGFLFGEGLFETWPTYRGRPFGLREHLARIEKSARALGIPFDKSENWGARTEKLAKLNNLTHTQGAVRLTITAGAGPVNLVPSQSKKPTRLMLFRPLEPGLVEVRANGIRVHLQSAGSGVNVGMRQLKTLNYLPAVLGKIEARKHGCFESLYRLSDRTVLEGTTSNFFVVKNGRLLTTGIGDGVLPGVTRAFVMAIANRITEVREQRITIDDLLSADELFLTSSTVEIAPIIGVDRRRIANAKPGEITREIQKRYRKMVARRTGLKVDQLD
jgi:branched-chain amino acid aminotransferase